MLKPTVVSFKEPLLLKNSVSRKRNANVHVPEVLAPNGEPLWVFKPYKPARWRRKTWTTTSRPFTCFLTLRPCNPMNSICPTSLSPKPKTTLNPFVSKVTTVSEIFSNGWIPSRRTTRVKSMCWPIISKGTMGTLSSTNTTATTASLNSSVTGANS